MQSLYCDPFVLVLGPSWKDVDKAVDILRKEIKDYHGQ